MCFSATASFVTAGATGIVAVACLLRANRGHEMLVAGIPALFAVQQAIEGLLWLILPISSDGAASRWLTLAFLLIATVAWPVYAPLAALRAETVPWRLRAIGLCLAAGVGVAATLLWDVLSGFPASAVIEHHIIYVVDRQPSAALGLGYLAATGLSLLVSSRPAIALLGVLVTIGSAAAYAFYWDSLTSVWCFFAAAGSLVVLGHFEWERRQDRRTVDAGARSR